MAGAGELSAAFRGLAEDAAQAGENIGKSMSRFFEDTAERADASIDTTMAAEEANAQAARAIRPSDENLPSGGAGGAGDGAPSHGSDRIARMLRGEDPGDATRQMSAEEPKMGWKSYGPLSPKAKSLSRALDRGGVVDIKPGEVGTSHLAELTRGYEGEVGIVQGPDGDLKLIRGKERAVRIPDDLTARGYKFVVHTHPEDRVPGELTEIDKMRGVRNTMTYDLEQRASGAHTHIEAVVNRHGDVTHFDHTGILSTSSSSMPGGPVNERGFVVPVKGR